MKNQHRIPIIVSLAELKDDLSVDDFAPDIDARIDAEREIAFLLTHGLIFASFGSPALFTTAIASISI